ncbi:hypothetical protein NTJ12_002271 [Flavobacterium psychrophilum]|nr:hypothetical protein [Flavobacterium psychrophilum]
MENQNIEIMPLSPFHHEFKDQDGKLDNIDYFYLSADYTLNSQFNKQLEEIIINRQKNIDSKYKFYSIYIYRKTDELNENSKKDKTSFDGYNNDLLAYIRFENKKLDIFYIIDDGNVIYDIIDKKETDFEFEN